ncbi:MAG: HAD-IIIC family phosphatase [Clostridiales Family XIII bacterium]|nr:HAD-IIIC family phosphatase [Clostridiales Family XIII bacterium]
MRKKLKKSRDGFAVVKLALVADQSTQFLAQALCGYGVTRRLDIHVYEAPFNQMEAEILDADSGLYAFAPDFVLLLPSSENLRDRFYRAIDAEQAEFAERESARLTLLCGALRERADADILLCNYCEQADAVYGNLGFVHRSSVQYALRALNTSLAEMANTESKLHIVDINGLQTARGRDVTYDPRLYYVSGSVFSFAFIPYVAARLVALIEATRGNIKKCLITDLDGVLWGGVIGEDGMGGIEIGELGMGRAHSDLQKWIKELSRRGIAIAVCSKNDEAIAKEPFLRHPDMILRMEDIAVFLANWEDKASNIRRVCATLNLTPDSMVFIDDNPFERELVKKILPAVTVPDLPEDAALYLETLCGLQLFETVHILDEDRARTARYREETSRADAASRATDLESYLSELKMKAEVLPFDSFSIPRVAQLTQRSNQFNLRTRRYTEREIEKIANDAKYKTGAVTLRDRFGAYGIICVFIMQCMPENTLFIDTFLMSCRVVKRGVEEFVFNEMVRVAKECGCQTITGSYLPTEKNAPVKDLLKNFGFAEDGDGAWTLEVDQYRPRETHIMTQNTLENEEGTANG